MTKRQTDMLAFLRRWFAEHQESPTYQQMAEAVGITSKSQVSATLTGLEKLGLIARHPRARRSVVLLPQREEREAEALAVLALAKPDAVRRRGDGFPHPELVLRFPDDAALSRFIASRNALPGAA